MESDNVRNKQLRKLWGCGRLEARDKVGHLGHSINKHEDRILAV